MVPFNVGRSCFAGGHRTCAVGFLGESELGMKGALYVDSILQFAIRLAAEYPAASTKMHQ